MAEEETANEKRTDRRSYLKKLVLGVLGAGALLSLKDVPKVTAGTGAFSYGVSETTHNAGGDYTGLQSSTSNVKGALYVLNTGGASALAVYGKSSNGTGVKGESSHADYYAVQGTNSAGTGVIGQGSGSSHFGVYGSNSDGIGVKGQSSSGIGVQALVTAMNGIPIVAKGHSSQTANLQEWQNNSATALSAVDKDGKLAVGHSAPAYMLDLRPPGSSTAQMHVSSTNTDAGGYLSSGNDTNLFMAGGAIYSGSGTSWIAKATSAYLFGGGVAGVRFYHDSGLTVGNPYTPTARMKIDSSGNVGIGTESPEQKLHVIGQVKATGFITGDITFANGYKVTEDNDRSGLFFLNQKGERIAKLDEQGNLRIKGDVIKDPTL